MRSRRRPCTEAALGLVMVLLGCTTLAWPAPVALAQRTRRPVVADSALTVDALARVTAFWTALAHVPDTVPDTLLIQARSEYGRFVRVDTVYSGRRIDRTEVVADMAALATHSPAVAAALRDAGLTRRQYTTLVATLLTTCRTANGMRWGNPVTPTPLQAKNIAWLDTHRQAFAALLAVAGPTILGLGDCARLAHGGA